MAASKLKFTRTTTDKLTVKAGTLSEDCTTITYTDENDMEQEVKVADLLTSFKNQVIDFKKDINSCIRITFSGNENKKELDYVCEKIKKNVEILKKLN